MSTNPEPTWLASLSQFLLVGLATWVALQPSSPIPITTNIKQNARLLYPNGDPELMELRVRQAGRQSWIAALRDSEDGVLIATRPCGSQSEALQRLNDVLEKEVKNEALKAAGRIICKL